jgi:hypothetical protein
MTAGDRTPVSRTKQYSTNSDSRHPSGVCRRSFDTPIGWTFRTRKFVRPWSRPPLGVLDIDRRERTELGRHLLNAVQIGAWCVYRAETGFNWNYMTAPMRDDTSRHVVAYLARIPSVSSSTAHGRARLLTTPVLDAAATAAIVRRRARQSSNLEPTIVVAPAAAGVVVVMRRRRLPRFGRVEPDPGERCAARRRVCALDRTHRGSRCR